MSFHEERDLDLERRLRRIADDPQPQVPASVFRYADDVAARRRGFQMIRSSSPGPRRSLVVGFASVAAVLVLAAGFTLVLRNANDVAGSPTPSVSAPADSPSASVSQSIGPSASISVFRPTGSMAHARYAPTAVVLKSGKVFVTGGDETGDDGTLREPSVEIYDPATGMFTAAGTMQSRRYYPAVAFLRDGRVLVAGGHDGRNYVRSAEIYDPATGTFSPTGAPLSDRQNGVAVTLSDGRVLIAGGSAGGAASTVGAGPTVTAELYDPSTGKFSATGSLTTNRFYGPPTATLLADGRVLLAGGGSNDGNGGLGGGIASAEVYDPQAGEFSATGSMTAARYNHTATLLPSGLVLIAGGYTGDDSSLSSAELYDPKTGKFTATGSLARQRGQHGATVLPDGRILMTGGWDFTRSTDGSGDVTEVVLSSSELYDPATGMFVEGSAMSMSRYGHAAVPLGDGSVLVLGGCGGSASEVAGLAAETLATAEVAHLPR